MVGMTWGTVPSSMKLGIFQRSHSSKDDNYDSNSGAQITEEQRNSGGGETAREVPNKQGNKFYRPNRTALKKVFIGGAAS